MKKSIGIVALAVCAMTITSCGAPTISREQAVAEANVIKETIAAGGEAAAGSVLALDYRTNITEEMMGMKETTESKGYVHIDMNQYYVRTLVENKVSVSGFGENESTTYSIEAYMFADGDMVYYGTIEKENGQFIQDYHSSSPFTEYETTLVNTIRGSYEQIDIVFAQAITAIFRVLDMYATDEALKQAGITLGSYGAGSLVITEKVDVTYNGQHQKSNTVIEFADYRLKTMESTVSADINGISKNQSLDYNFNYDKCPINKNI